MVFNPSEQPHRKGAIRYLVAMQMANSFFNVRNSRNNENVANVVLVAERGKKDAESIKWNAKWKKNTERQRSTFLVFFENSMVRIKDNERTAHNLISDKIENYALERDNTPTTAMSNENEPLKMSSQQQEAHPRIRRCTTVCSAIWVRVCVYIYEMWWER